MKELQELFDLYEIEMMNRLQPKPELGNEMPSSYGGPNKDNFQHPINQQRNDVDYAIAQGEDPTDAHQQVFGAVDPSDVEAKASLAATLGRLQDDGTKNTVKLDKDSNSILARDARLEAGLDQVTPDDLRTPMNQQVPDNQQTPQDQVAEQLEIQNEIDYNDDVAYLQKYGRA